MAQFTREGTVGLLVAMLADLLPEDDEGPQRIPSATELGVELAEILERAGWKLTRMTSANAAAGVVLAAVAGGHGDREPCYRRRNHWNCRICDALWHYERTIGGGIVPFVPPLTAEEALNG